MFKNLLPPSLTMRFRRLLDMMINFAAGTEPSRSDRDLPSDDQRGNAGAHPDYRLFAQ